MKSNRSLIEHLKEYNNTQNDNLYQADMIYVEWLLDAIDRQVLPAVTIGGLLLQSLNVIVLLSKHLHKNAIRFLAVMSFVDVLFLFVQLPFLPMPFLALDESNASPSIAAYCHFVQHYYERFVLYPMSRVCLATNSWLAVFVTFERYLALRPGHWCACASRYGVSRRKLSLPAILFAVVLAFVLNANSFFNDRKTENSNTIADSEDLTESCVALLNGQTAVVRFLLTYILPLVLLLVFNTALFYQLLQYRRKQLRIRPTNRLEFENGHLRNLWSFSNCWRGAAHRRRQVMESSLRSHRRSRSTLNTAMMVLAAMLVHLAFSAPGFALTVLVHFEVLTVSCTKGWFVLASNASNVLVLVHCSIVWYVCSQFMIL